MSWSADRTPRRRIGFVRRDSARDRHHTGLNSPCRWHRSPRRCPERDGVALKVARRRKEHRYPERSGQNNRCRLVVLSGEVGGRLSTRVALSSDLWRYSEHGQLRKFGDSGGGHCSLARSPGRLQTPWRTFERRVAQAGTSRGGRTVVQRRHVLAEFGSVQISPWPGSSVLLALDSSVGLHSPAIVPFQLVGETSGAVEVPDGVASEVVQLPFRKEDWVFGVPQRLAPAACLASWADCLSQVYARAQQVCAEFLEELEGPPSRAQCVREALDAATLLARESMEVPEWSRFPVADFRAPQPVDPEVGEWTHGWQFHASIARDSLFAISVRLPPLSTDDEALRASQRGLCASRHFSCLPTCQETTFSAEEFRTLLLLRLHLPLHMDARFCKLLVVYGHHRSACSRIGFEAASDPGRGMARICREAGARAKENQMLRGLNIVAPAGDQHRQRPFWEGK